MQKLTYYDCIIRYGENNRNEMSSGYYFVTQEAALDNGNKFLANTKKHYPDGIVETFIIPETEYKRYGIYEA